MAARPSWASTFMGVGQRHPPVSGQLRAAVGRVSILVQGRVAQCLFPWRAAERPHRPRCSGWAQHSSWRWVAWCFLRWHQQGLQLTCCRCCQPLAEYPISAMAARPSWASTFMGVGQRHPPVSGQLRGLNISCRYAGVFHVEKNRRYSLTREEAIELCKALNSTLPTWEQMEKAFSLGLETCRYGYIEEKIVVPRHNPYHLCAANTTGIYVLQSNVSDRYDTYCFNSSEARDKVCDPVTELYSSWPDDQSII
ncbi:UNVERIFIED_CONTAM: hypothetical protein K2H54_055901, partial [Gekko kuhli]